LMGGVRVFVFFLPRRRPARPPAPRLTALKDANLQV
jgi:hypothetical protein